MASGGYPCFVMLIATKPSPMEIVLWIEENTESYTGYNFHESGLAIIFYFGLEYDRDLCHLRWNSV